MDLSIFATPEAWISLITLTFLEVVLGVDNIVFIVITTGRLPEKSQALGRKLGLAGALVSRIAFLSVASYLVHMVDPIFTIRLGDYNHGLAIRDFVLLFGGAYLIYKGIEEILEVMSLKDLKNKHGENISSRTIALPQAIGTVMVMDIVFSIDSVITAVGLANHLIIMIVAVCIAIVVMMVFIDAISDFINRNVEMNILALVFIATIGVLLVLDGLGINSGIEVLDMHMEKLMVYFAMVFAVVLELIQLAYKKRIKEWETSMVASAGHAAEDSQEDEEPTE